MTANSMPAEPSNFPNHSHFNPFGVFCFVCFVLKKALKQHVLYVSLMKLLPLSKKKITLASKNYSATLLWELRGKIS